jgi:hypothetical protein
MPEPGDQGAPGDQDPDPSEPQGSSRLDWVMSRLDRYIDPMDSPRENSMVNSQYDSLPISHSILHRA